MNAIAYAADAAVSEVTLEGAAGAAGGILQFLFGTYTGLAILVGSFLLISLGLAFILEWRTRRVFKDRGPAAPGSSFFDDDEEDAEAEAAKK